jgi:hypothetical protein
VVPEELPRSDNAWDGAYRLKDRSVRGRELCSFLSPSPKGFPTVKRKTLGGRRKPTQITWKGGYNYVFGIE